MNEYKAKKQTTQTQRGLRILIMAPWKSIQKSRAMMEMRLARERFRVTVAMEMHKRVVHTVKRRRTPR